MNELKVGDAVAFMLGMGTGTGHVVQVNDESVIVRLRGGPIIKRHIEKHRVNTVNHPLRRKTDND